MAPPKNPYSNSILISPPLKKNIKTYKILKILNKIGDDFDPRRNAW
jgi:hypothetical protein